MAVDFEQYQKSPEAMRTSMTNQALGRIEGNLVLGPQMVADLPRFFRDVYLLDRASVFNLYAGTLDKVQVLAKHKRIRGEFVNFLRKQDTAGESQEVLATLHVGRLFGYDRETPFRVGFDQLRTKHDFLIAEKERQRVEEETRRRAEEAAAAATAEAQFRASQAWPPRESNAGKSPEWVQAQERIAQLWEQRKQTLTHAAADEIDVPYLEAGFNLLKEQMLSTYLLAQPPLAVRAMLDYLIPEIWQQPRLIEKDLNELRAENKANPEPTSLSGLSRLQKILIVPANLQNLPARADNSQKGQLTRIFRKYSTAIHPDGAISKHPDVPKNQLDHVAKIYNAVFEAWNRGRDWPI